jgi:ATP-dependent 26S proteasome regulatory subunit
MLIWFYLSYFLSTSILNHQSVVKTDISIFKDFPYLDYKSLNNHEIKMCNYIIPNNKIDVTFKQIGGYVSQKEQIMFCIDMLKKKIPSNDLLQLPNGIILHGPPGTGKTMFAKACASESKCAFINLCPTSFENQYYGESLQLLKACFDLASKIKPCIIFIDEMDGFLSVRNALEQSHVNSIKTLFLSLMDGILSKDKDIFVIGATNRLNAIDPAVKRRMSSHIFMDLPTVDETTIILKQLLCKEKLDKAFDFNVISEYCFKQEFSGSDIQQFVKAAAKNRFINNNKKPWTETDLIP